MKIGDKTSDALDEVLTAYDSHNPDDPYPAPFFNECLKYVIQTYLSEVWKPFDKDDVRKLDPHTEYLCITNEFRGDVAYLQYFKYNGLATWRDSDLDTFENVTHYLDPADILPDLWTQEEIDEINETADKLHKSLNLPDVRQESEVSDGS